MQRWGNKRANEYWEYKLPKDYPRPNEKSSMAALEKFIRAKYEKRMWVRDNDSDYDYSSSESDSDSKPLSAINSNRSKTAPVTPAVSSPSPSTPLRQRVSGGLSSLSHRSGSLSPIEDLFMSFTLKPAANSGVDTSDREDSSRNLRTASIAELYGPKSPQVGVEPRPLQKS